MNESFSVLLSWVYPKIFKSPTVQFSGTTSGGGVKSGYVGATDEIGGSAIDVVHPIKDLHATILHLLGLNDNKLTFLHGGHYKQLSQTGADVITEIIA